MKKILFAALALLAIAPLGAQQISIGGGSSGGGSGTVTSITAASPLTGGTITGSGTIGLGTVPIGSGGTNATTASGARAALAAAASGANSDITSLTGLTTALTAPQGGTGQSTYTDGQLLIGNTATGVLSKATLTAGSNITITNGNGTISIAAAGGGGSGCVTSGAANAPLYDTGSGGCGSAAGSLSSAGRHVYPASTTSSAFLNLPAGSAPTSPVNGDVWTTSAGIYAQIAGTTVGPFGSGGGLSAITANSVLANATGGSATPAAVALPSCSGASSALTYTTSSGFGCNTISGGSGSPGGSTGQIQYNNAGAFAGSAATTTSGGNTVNPAAGAASTSAIQYTGALFTGGSATTTYPMFYLDPSTTTSATWSVNGTVFGINTPSGFVGNAIDVQANGTTAYKVTSTGVVTAAALTLSGSGSMTAGATGQVLWNGRGVMSSPAVGQVQLGTVDVAAPTAQTLSAMSVSAGTTNTAGVSLTIQASRGTGTGAGGDIIFKVAPAGSTGTAQNALVTGFTISKVGVPVRPGFTVSTLPAAPSAGAFGYVTDATACTFLAAPTGGGGTFCPVVYNGSAWVAG